MFKMGCINVVFQICILVCTWPEGSRSASDRITILFIDKEMKMNDSNIEFHNLCKHIFIQSFSTSANRSCCCNLGGGRCSGGGGGCGGGCSLGVVDHCCGGIRIYCCRQCRVCRILKYLHITNHYLPQTQLHSNTVQLCKKDIHTVQLVLSRHFGADFHDSFRSLVQ